MKTLALLLSCCLLLVACSQPDPPSTTLYLAMRRGDLEQIDRHIRHGSDMNQLDREGLAPLHVAVRDGRMAITRLLLRHGVDVERHDKDGYTPLYYALLAGQVRIAELLRKHGARLDATAMLLALVQQGVTYRDSIRYLAEQGADLEVRDATGDTPLLIAIRQGNHKLAKHLVNVGADVTVRDTRGQSALAIARAMNLQDIELLLLRNGAE